MPLDWDPGVESLLGEIDTVEGKRRWCLKEAPQCCVVSPALEMNQFQGIERPFVENELIHPPSEKGRSNKIADFVHQVRESNLLDGRAIYRGFEAKERWVAAAHDLSEAFSTFYISMNVTSPLNI